MSIIWNHLVTFYKEPFSCLSSDKLNLLELGQVLADHPLEPAAHGDRLRFRNIGETKQEATFALIFDRAAGKNIDSKSRRLGLAPQVGFTHFTAQPPAELHSA